MKIYYAKTDKKKGSFEGFLEGLEPKMRRKLLMQCVMLIRDPTVGEPHVKHFSIEKYTRLYELRAKSKVLMRVIFAFNEDGDAIMLTPFIKKQTRNTMQALDSSLRLLSEIESGSCPLIELKPEKIVEGLN